MRPSRLVGLLAQAAGAGGLVLLAAACGTADPIQDAAAVAFEVLLDEGQSGLEEPLREVVRDDGRWAELWAAIHGGVDPQPPRPTVDFSREMLIGVALGTRPTGGFDITVQSVRVGGDGLHVEVEETCPAPDEIVAMVLTRPVEVVRIERLSLAAEFDETRTSCE